MRLLLVVSLLVASQSTDAVAQPSRLVELLEITNNNYEKRGSVWIVRFRDKAGRGIDVVLRLDDSVLVIAANVALAKEVRESTNLYRELLKFNADAYYVKAVIDGDGDYNLQMETELAGVTGRLLDSYLNQVASGEAELRAIFLKHRK